MKIIHVAGSTAPRYGGPSTAVQSYSVGLAAIGHSVTLVTTNADGPSTSAPNRSRFDAFGVDLIVGTAIPPRRFATAPGLIWRMKDALAEADIVHIHSLYLFTTLIASRWSKHLDVPYVLRPHGALTEHHYSRGNQLLKRVYETAVEDRTAQHAAAFHFASEVEARESYASGFPVGRSFVCPIPLECDTEQVGTVIMRRQARLDRSATGAISVLFFGRFAAKKRPRIMLEAVAQASQEGLPIHLTMAGPDDEVSKDELRTLAVRLGIAELVTIRGQVNGDAAKKMLFGEADLLALPSVGENFGLTVIEALAAGLPVVTTPHVGVTEKLLGNPAVRLCVPDPLALAAEMRDLARDLRKGNGESLTRSAVQAAEQFAPALVARQLEREYRSLI